MYFPEVFMLTSPTKLMLTLMLTLADANVITVDYIQGNCMFKMCWIASLLIEVAVFCFVLSEGDVLWTTACSLVCGIVANRAEVS